MTGLDPSALLWRPFAGTETWQVGGVGSELGAHVALLERLVETTDARIAAVPADRDATGPELPVLLVVLEEYAGLLRVADVTDPTLGSASVPWSLGCSARAARPESGSSSSCSAPTSRSWTASCAQCELRVSFSVDSGEAVRILHPAAEEVARRAGRPAQRGP